MKLILRFLLLLVFIHNSVTAQEYSKTESDSIVNVIDEAFSLRNQHKTGEALQLTSSVLKLLDKRDDTFLRAKTYNIIGTCYIYLSDGEKAKNNFIKSKDLFVKIKDTSNIIKTYNNIGVSQRLNKKYKSALQYFTKSYNLALENKNFEEAVYSSYNIGNNLIIHQKKTKLAISYFLKSLDYAKEVKLDSSKSIISNIYLLLGDAYSKNNQSAKTFEYYNKTETNAGLHGHLYVLGALYETKADYFKQIKDFQSANVMLEKEFKIRDSLNTLKEYDLVMKIETEYLVKEKEDRLKFVEKEKESQAIIIKKSKVFNIVMFVFSSLLLFGVYYIFNRNKQLKKAKVSAENLSKAKSNFYSEISHELRTPLYAVIELSGLMLRENDNIEHKEYLESLKFSGNHLMSLINNVLELNKVESGEMKLNEQNFSLKTLTINIIDSLEYALQNSNNQIHLNYDAELPETMVGDSLKLSQVLINLISNAIKFTHNGHINITIKKVDSDEDKSVVYFEVKDDGLGIPKEKQAKIFEDFYQEHSKNENSYKGTGLGLSIVKLITDTMGSTIEIESEENVGSTFFFTVKFNKTGNIETERVERVIYNEAIKGARILVVDDNKINQIVTKKVLEDLEIRPFIASDGTEAISLIKKDDFDCILMDLHMPGLNSYETTERIREFNLNIPIIALTAASTEEVEKKIKYSKMNGYILKPFLTVDLIDKIYSAIIKS